MVRETRRECTVCVRSEQKNLEGETQSFEVKGRGHLSEREGTLFVLYEENMEEAQEKTGRENKTVSEMRVKNLLKIEEEPLRVSLKKSGAVSWKMIFEQGKHRESEYGTPYGALKIGTETTRLTLKKERKKISLQLLYALFIQGEKQADCRLELEFTILPD